MRAIVQVPLRRRDGSIVAYAIVDAIDAPKALANRWYLGTRGYAMRQYRDPTDPPGRKRCRAEFLHRRLMGDAPVPGLEVDHIDRDKLNNRRRNLRWLSRSENEQNKAGTRAASGFRNVFFNKQRASYFARVRVDGKQHVSKDFSTAAEAAAVAAAFRERFHRCAPR